MKTKTKSKNSNISSFKTGNYRIKVDRATGTKTRKRIAPNEAIGRPLPESIDVKITNFCDMSSICTYCHEESDIMGRHADYDAIRKIFTPNRLALELAIGGGDPMKHPLIGKILKVLHAHNYICNITVNSLHLKQHHKKLEQFIDEEKIYGLGVSYRKEVFRRLPDYDLLDYEHLVWHMIMGVTKPRELEELLATYPGSKVLLLGYKNFGRGSDHLALYTDQVHHNLNLWRWQIREFLDHPQVGVLSFDNLAIEQLKLQRLFTQQQWEKFYMGNDGDHSCYIDMVEQQIARNSYASTRKDLSGFIARHSTDNRLAVEQFMIS